MRAKDIQALFVQWSQEPGADNLSKPIRWRGPLVAALREKLLSRADVSEKEVDEFTECRTGQSEELERRLQMLGEKGFDLAPSDPAFWKTLALIIATDLCPALSVDEDRLKSGRPSVWNRDSYAVLHARACWIKETTRYQSGPQLAQQLQNRYPKEYGSLAIGTLVKELSNARREVDNQRALNLSSNTIFRSVLEAKVRTKK